jgi:DNA-binding MarR family transcriptional regulator
VSNRGSPSSRSAAFAARSLRLDEYLPYRLSVAANAVSQLVSRAYAERFGLPTPQWRLLAVLGEDGARTQQQLCGRTLMDKVTVMRAARGLAHRRLVRREPNAQDGRSHRLHLTAAGRRVYRQIAPLALGYESALLAGLDRRQIRTLEQWLRLLQATAAALTAQAASVPAGV